VLKSPEKGMRQLDALPVVQHEPHFRNEPHLVELRLRNILN